MSVRALALTALLVAVSVAGCLEGSGDLSASTAPASQPPATTGPATTTSSAPPSSSPAANQPPGAILAVSVDGASVSASNGTHEVPAGKNVTLDASGSTDPDGDELTYAWTVDGASQSSTNSSLIVSFADGSHTVVVDVSDGAASDSADAVLVVASAAPPSGPVGDAATVLEFKGSFAQASDGADKKFPFDVPAGAKQVTAYLTWSDHVLGNDALFVDLDLFILNPKNSQVVARETLDFEYAKISDPSVLDPGTWTARVLAYGDGVVGAGPMPVTTDYTLKIIVWMAAPTVKEFKGSKNGVNLGAGGDAITGNVKHDLDIPAGVGIVAARLGWTNAAGAATSSVAYRSNDYDLYVFASGKQQMSSGNGLAQEFAFLDVASGSSVLAGKWTFEVVPFAVYVADYTLTVEYA